MHRAGFGLPREVQAEQSGTRDIVWDDGDTTDPQQRGPNDEGSDPSSPRAAKDPQLHQRPASHDDVDKDNLPQLSPTVTNKDSTHRAVVPAQRVLPPVCSDLSTRYPQPEAGIDEGIGQGGGLDPGLPAPQRRQRAMECQVG